ncbi:hypothetical protein J3F84DRAFT_373032 [Trichoderma pleuroticola]
MPRPCHFPFVIIIFFSSPVSAEASVSRSDDGAGRALRMFPPTESHWSAAVLDKGRFYYLHVGSLCWDFHEPFLEGHSR